jgi:hypothetical protein
MPHPSRRLAPKAAWRQVSRKTGMPHPSRLVWCPRLRRPVALRRRMLSRAVPRRSRPSRCRLLRVAVRRRSPRAPCHRWSKVVVLRRSPLPRSAALCRRPPRGVVLRRSHLAPCRRLRKLAAPLRNRVGQPRSRPNLAGPRPRRPTLVVPPRVARRHRKRSSRGTPRRCRRSRAGPLPNRPSRVAQCRRRNPAVRRRIRRRAGPLRSSPSRGPCRRRMLVVPRLRGRRRLPVPARSRGGSPSSPRPSAASPVTCPRPTAKRRKPSRLPSRLVVPSRPRSG